MSTFPLRKPVLAAFLAALTVVHLTGGPAGAEQSGRDGVVVSFDARISPHVLPRKDLAPVSVSISGGVRSVDGAAPPRLRRFELSFGARGGVDVAGLPVCPHSRLRNATRNQALTRCRGALVGRGTILAEVPLAAERPMLARARALAFNARKGGQPAVLVHAYSASPPVSFVLPIRLRTLRQGAYGMRLEILVAKALGRWPRLRSFHISLGRRYRGHGERHSYLRAHCPLPPRIPSLSVPIARATYQFNPAPRIPITILRACRVRD